MKFFIALFLFCLSSSVFFPLHAASLTINSDVEEEKIFVIVKGQGGMQQMERSYHFPQAFQEYHVPEGTKVFGTGFLHNYTNDLWFFAVSENCVWSGDGRRKSLKEKLYGYDPEHFKNAAAKADFIFKENTNIALRHVTVKADSRGWPLFEINLSRNNADNGCQGHDLLKTGLTHLN